MLVNTAVDSKCIHSNLRSARLCETILCLGQQFETLNFKCFCCILDTSNETKDVFLKFSIIWNGAGSQYCVYITRTGNFCVNRKTSPIT